MGSILGNLFHTDASVHEQRSFAPRVVHLQLVTATHSFYRFLLPKSPRLMSKRRYKTESNVSHKRQRIEEPSGRRDRLGEANSEIVPIHKPCSTLDYYGPLNSKVRSFYVILLLKIIFCFLYQAPELEIFGKQRNTANFVHVHVVETSTKQTPMPKPEAKSPPPATHLSQSNLSISSISRQKQAKNMLLCGVLGLPSDRARSDSTRERKEEGVEIVSRVVFSVSPLLSPSDLLNLFFINKHIMTQI